MGPEARRLRVAVTLEQLWHDVPGGTATAALGSLRGLGQHASEALDLIGVSARHRCPPPAELDPGIVVRSLPLPRPALYEAWHDLGVPAVERATGPVDVIHATAMAVPPRTAPLVVTVHDLAFLDQADAGTAWGRRFFRRSLALARARADVVICPSVATMADCETAGFDRRRLRLVPWGVDPAPASAADLDRVAERYRLGRPYVLWVGTVEPRKNLPALLEAWPRVHRAHPDTELILVGPRGWSVELEALVAGLGAVRALGRVPAADLAGLYAGASAFCFPSHREGFGLPVLEALAQGTPVVTSRGTATAEIVGDHGVAGELIDPTDSSSIAEALVTVLAEPDPVRSMAARERAREFSWTRTAEALLEAYRDAASAPRRRIGANLLWLVPGVVGGSEEYSVRLLDAAGHTAGTGHELVLLANRRLPDAHPELCRRHPTLVAPLDGGNKVLRVAAENVWLPFVARRERLAAVHHLGGTAPLATGRPTVLTVHDLQPWAHPEHFGALKRGYLHLTVPRAVRRARAVCVLSNFVRDDLITRLGVDGDRITLVPPALDAVIPPSDAEGVLARHELAGRAFFLYPVITYPHKNHLVLLEALSRLPDRTAVLVLSGGEAQAEDAVRARVADLSLGPRVRRTGRLPRAELEVLFDRAVAVVFPSRYEGFGLGVLEAMHRGCPVVAADTTALVEVVDGAGLLVAPGDVDGWVQAMQQVLDDPDLRHDLGRRGRERARAFDWERSAAALAGVYHRVAP